MRGHSEKVAVYKPREVSEDTNPTNSLTSHFQPPEI